MNYKKNARLYVIDDDKYFIYGVSKGLRIADYCSEVLFFDDPEDALESIRETIDKNQDIPDVIFLDINMPALNGWEFLDELRILQMKTDHPIRVYMVSSSVMESDMVKALSYPEVESYLTKPLSKEMLETVFHVDS